jgi:hypothetical protein
MGGGNNDGITLGAPTPTEVIHTSGASLLDFHPSYALGGERDYSFDPNTNITMITLRITNLANYNRTLVIKDTIPKSIATTLSDVQVTPAPTTVYNPDPEIGWNVTLTPKETFTITYVFNRYISFGKFSAMSLPSITEITSTGTQEVSPTSKITTAGGITGLVIGALGNPFVGLLVLIIVLAAFFATTETGKKTWKKAKKKTNRFISDFMDELREPEK